MIGINIVDEFIARNTENVKYYNFYFSLVGGGLGGQLFAHFIFSQAVLKTNTLGKRVLSVLVF
jgi:hypothetical protein